MYSLRRSCQAPCVLSFDRLDCRGVIQNVSLSGTLIRLRKVPDGVRPGDTCGLRLYGEECTDPIIHTCRVVRLEEDHVALELLELGCDS